MATIHVTEAEAIRNLAALLARVRAGTEVVIDSDTAPVALVRANTLSGASLSDVLDLLAARRQESGRALMMEEDFAADLENIIQQRQPRHSSRWD